MGQDRDRESLTPVQQFVEALHAEDVSRVHSLLQAHADVRAAVNAPVSHFDGRPVMRARKNLALLDVLLEYGADINLKSAWWAGGFGILEHDITPAEAAPIIARGAVVDVFAAAHLGMFDRLRALVDADSSLVHARGGDGKTPLHNAKTIAIASYLLDRGADVNARDVDHESTPAQYLLAEAPDVVRFLISRGATIDIFMAAALGDRGLLARCLDEDPSAIGARVGEGRFRVRHNGREAATADAIGNGRGDIYRWVLGHHATPFDVARRAGRSDLLAALLERASPAQRLLSAASAADREGAERVLAANPGILARLTAGERRVIADCASDGNTAAVALMVDLGFDTRPTGQDNGDALHWAAYLGKPDMVRALLARDPAIGVRDASHQGTALDWCIYGAVFGGHPDADFVTCVHLLLGAGEVADGIALPTGRDDIDAVLRDHRKRATP